MRSSLLSLQQTAKLQSLTQQKMATGKKINTAIDNPSSYYTATALNNQAGDLSLLLNNISQSAQLLQTAVQTLETGGQLLQQAASITTQTLENVSFTPPETIYDGPIAARVTTQNELLQAINENKEGVIVIDNDITFDDNISLVLKPGQKIVGRKFVENRAPDTKLKFNFTGNTGIAFEMAENSELSDLTIDYKTVQKASNNNFYTIRNNNKKGVVLNNLDLTYISEADSNFAGAVISNKTSSEMILRGKINISLPENKKSSHAIINDGTLIQEKNSVINITSASYGSAGIFAGKTAENFLNGKVNIKMTGENGYATNYGIYNITGRFDAETAGGNATALNYGTYNVSGTLNVTTHGRLARGINSAKVTVNGTANVTTYGQYGTGLYTSTAVISGKVNIRTYNSSAGAANGQIQLLPSAQLYAYTKLSNVFDGANITWEAGAQIGMYKEGATIDSLNIAKNAGTAKISNTLEPADWNTVSTFPLADFAASFNPPDEEEVVEEVNKEAKDKEKIDAYSQQYNNILSQYDQLIKDGSYKGVNLLVGNSMVVNFNQSRSSSLKINGMEATQKDLGLSVAAWTTLDDINNSITELTAAVNKLRSFSSEFGNYHSIISGREEFTKNMIEVLTEGADKLTLADMNEEAANMLALQTRQQLAVNALSLSSEAAQSILKLF